MEDESEKTEKEKRIRAITKIYYSNPVIQKALLDFSTDREVIPRYFEGFGKRPDTLQYMSDIMGLVNRGATSFHASEEIWENPLNINSEMNVEELNKERKGWDLLIDIDSPFLDCSKIAAELIIDAMEHHGIRNYGIKFSGSKGFHIIVSGKAFPKEFDGIEMSDAFPEWPRAISEYLMSYIRSDYNKLAAEILSNVDAIQRRTNIKREDLFEIRCKECNKKALGGEIIVLKCPVCGLSAEKKNPRTNKKRLRCLSSKCPGFLETIEERKYHYCEYCKDPENENLQLDSERHPDSFEKFEGVSAEKVASLDMVLVAPRHLFRMPYSLHEKTALSSIVLSKEEIKKFNPKDADPLRIKIRNYFPENSDNEAKRLLAAALEWKKAKESKEEKIINDKYKGKEFAPIDLNGVDERLFPNPIKKLLAGVKDGRKRGLFVLISFFRTLGFSVEYINKEVREWNKRNENPLKEGYIRSQIEWFMKQRKKILPPNYSNESFYRDLGILEKKPEAKNPIVEVLRKLKSDKNN